MNPIALIAAAAFQPAPFPPASPGDSEIVVTASRETAAAEQTPASVTVIEEERLERLDLPLASDLLRLVPGVAVGSTGPRGTLTQVRIRGAEANHSLLFVDGIRFNDPAAGNEARFELLAADDLSRIEVVRGPQSALWGSEALGGVVAVEGPDPFRGNAARAYGEYGSLDTARLGGRFALGSGDFGVSGSAGLIRSDGIDSFAETGERDGFDNRHAGLRLAYRPSGGVAIGLVGHIVGGRSEFDDTDPTSFLRADTLHSTENQLFAIGGWGSAEAGGWRLRANLSLLDSENRNFLAEAPLNDTFGRRHSAGLQLSRSFGGHRITGAAEYEREAFSARDFNSGGATDQDRSRDLWAFVGEWRAEWSDRLFTGLALRHDSFSGFADSTTLRASALFRLAAGWSLHAGYGEGIARPTFYDLYGFFPGSFVGNPNLRPERSAGWEAGVRWQGGRARVGVTAFVATLEQEIVDVFGPAASTTANASGESRRRGVELDAGYRLSEALNLAFSYTYLDAEEGKVAGNPLARETRRPGHTANLTADGRIGAFSWGVAVAYVGERTDVDFDIFQTVTLDDYVLASATLAYRISPLLELYGRVENGLDAGYQDVAGYNTTGRTVYAGIRLRLGD